MALQLNDLLMRLSPTQHHPMTDGEDKSMERKRLQLAREQFAEVKRKNAEDAEYHRIAEAGEMTRAHMQDERQRAQQAALAQAETLKQRREAHDTMLKYRDTGDYEGMETAANRLNELGGLAERTGEDEHGLPTWHVELDAEKYKKEQAALEARQAPGEVDNPENPYSTHPGDESTASSLSRLGALGYPGTDRGTLMPPAGIGSSDDMTPEQLARVTGGGSQQRAATDRAVAQPPLEVERDIGPPAADADPAEDTSPIKPEYRQAPQGLDPLAALRPARLGPVAPDQADIMGGVPKNVIDTGAMNAQAQRRLGPVMANIEASMPAAYRGATEHNDAAAAGLGLPVDKALDLSLKLRAPADAAIARERSEEAALAKEKAKEGKPLTPHEEQVLIHDGKNSALTDFKTLKLQPEIGAMRSATEIITMLEDNDSANDDKAINFLMSLAVQKGAQTDADALRMTGGKINAWDKVSEWLHEQFKGGYGDQIKGSMKQFAHEMRDQSKAAVFDWMHSQNEAANNAVHPLVAKGYREAVNAMPAWLRKEYDKENPPEEEPEEADAPGATPVSAAVDDGDGNDFEDAVDAAAEDKGLDPDKWRAVTGPESKGDGNAKNPHSSASGIIQMIDEVAREYVNPRTGKKFANAAELRGLPREEQAPIAAEYLHDKGLTADSPQEDYDLAVAAPAFVGKSANRDAVVYPKGSDKYEANPLWQPKDGGDITVGSILDFYARNRKGGAEAPASTKPAAGGQDAARKKLLEGL